MKTVAGLLLCSLLLVAGLSSAADSDDDVYKEDAIRPYVDKQVDEIPEPKEQKTVIPAYPRENNLVEVDIDRYGYPYRLFVDTASVSVGKDRIVHYTAVLRSKSGVDNVSYEGIRCARQQFKRYAYGSGGKFYPVTSPEWKRIHQTRQDIYREVLANEILCPLPGGDDAAQIVAKLKRHGNLRDRFANGDE